MSVKLQFLFADDDEDDREFFMHACQKYKDQIDLITVSDGKQLIDLLSGSPEPTPSLIILDINMPRINGYQCLDHIRKSEKWKQTPVVMYTTSSNDIDIYESFTGGANSFIIKPHSMPDIEKVVETLVTKDFSSRPTSLNGFVIRH